MAGEAGRAMMRLQVIYNEHEPRFRAQEAGMAAEGRPVRCASGCDDCCYLLVTCTIPEALAMVHRMRLDGTIKEFIRARPWERDEEDLHRDGMTNLEWMRMRRPCLHLDTATRTCRVYDARPAVCRQYAVVTDPALCAIPNSDIATPDRRQEREEVFVASMAIAADLKLPVAMLPLPVAMKWACIVYLDGAGALAAALRRTAFASGLAATFYWASLDTPDGRTFEYDGDGWRCRVCGDVTPDDGGPPRCASCGMPHRTGAP